MIIGINNSAIYNGTGQYANRMQTIKDLEIYSFIMDKRKSDYAFTGNIIKGIFPPITNGYWLNVKTIKKRIDFYAYWYEFPHILNPFYYAGNEYSRTGIVTIHDLYYKYMPETLYSKMTKKIVEKYKQYENIITVSNTVKDEMIKEGFNEEKISVIYNYVDDKIFYPNKVNKIDSQITVLTVGDGKSKNNDIVRKITKENDYCHIHIGNDIVADINYTHISNNQLCSLYNISDVYVRLADFEGFGYPPVESLFCGTPVVVSDIPTYRETLGDAGVYANKDTLVEGIEYALNNRQYLLNRFNNIKSAYSKDIFYDKMNKYYEMVRNE